MGKINEIIESKQAPGGIVLNYNHSSGINRGVNCHIKNGVHYRDEMKRRGLVSFEDGCAMAEDWEKHKKRKPYKLKEDTKKFMAQVEQSADKKGNLVLGSRAIDKMKKIGVKFAPHEHQPVEVKTNGGFDDAV